MGQSLTIKVLAPSTLRDADLAEGPYLYESGPDVHEFQKGGLLRDLPAFEPWLTREPSWIDDVLSEAELHLLNPSRDVSGVE